MFDITYLVCRFFRFIKRYPRTWTIIGFITFFFIGIWVGRVVEFEKIPNYFKSYTDPIRTDETRQVMPGIVHRQILDDGVLTNILAIQPDTVDIKPYRALSAGIGTEYLTSIARRHHAPIAINGGYYEMSGDFRGESVGALKIDGEWVSEPEQGRGVLGIKTVNGKIQIAIDRITLQHQIVLANGTTLEIDGINRGRTKDELILYRPIFHSVTLTMPDGVEVVVKNDRVVDIRDGNGSTPIPDNGYVLSAHGRKREQLLKHISLGASIKINESVIPERVGDSKYWEDYEHVIGGGPLLLRNGVISTKEMYEREGFKASFHSFWHPRTAVGKKEDGTLLFVTITGADPRVRRGVTIQTLAKLFVEWGATDAVNLDGGYSSMMVIRNQVVSIKFKRPNRAQSDKNSKRSPPEKLPQKNVKTPSSEKLTDKDAKPVLAEIQDANKKETVSPEKKETKKEAPEKPTKSARGNLRIRPIPTFQGRAVSDAILIFPRNLKKK